MFQNNALRRFIDSSILKFAVVKTYDSSHDTVNAEISFLSGIIKNVAIQYDTRNSILIAYKIKTFQAIGNQNGKVTGITQIVSCSDFKKDNIEQYKPDNFFRYQNGQLSLKKFGKYKIYSQL